MQKIKFDEEYCKGCELCTTVCPKTLIQIDMTRINRKGYNVAFVEDTNACVSCGNCAVICPDSVIEVNRI